MSNQQTYISPFHRLTHYFGSFYGRIGHFKVDNPLKPNEKLVAFGLGCCDCGHVNVNHVSKAIDGHNYDEFVPGNNEVGLFDAINIFKSPQPYYKPWVSIEEISKKKDIRHYDF